MRDVRPARIPPVRGAQSVHVRTMHLPNVHRDTPALASWDATHAGHRAGGPVCAAR